MNKLHTFYCEKDKKPTEMGNEFVNQFWWLVPSVTKVLAETMPNEKKIALANWREKIGEAEADRIVKEAKERGIAFDKAIQQYTVDGISETKYINDFFLNMKIAKLQMGFLYIDRILDNGIPLGFKGFIDFEMCDAKDKYLVDTKTWGKHKFDNNGNPRPEWVELDYYLQVCAYSKALNYDKAMILGSDGNSFQAFTIFDIKAFYAQFEKRLLAYIHSKNIDNSTPKAST